MPHLYPLDMMAVAFGLAGVFAIVARLVGWLSTGGALAATAVGGAVFTQGHRAGLLLATFFISGSILTAFNQPRRTSTVPEDGPRRNARQVLANGAWAAVASFTVPVAPAIGWTAIIGAIAAAQADTWATEIGARAPDPPRLITTRRPVTPGTSGGVTGVGTLGGGVGAAVIAGFAAVLGMPLAWCAAGLIGGITGMLADSVLGATVQARYRCEPCAMETESRVHRCGAAASLVRGYAWLDNDGVNFVATGLGGLVAIAVSYL